jgi:hypothetical protein
MRLDGAKLSRPAGRRTSSTQLQTTTAPRATLGGRKLSLAASDNPPAFSSIALGAKRGLIVCNWVNDALLGVTIAFCSPGVLVYTM